MSLGLTKLDRRLEAAARMVLPGRPFADIGTDHAYLPVYLVEQDICPSGIAGDVAAGPCQAARRIISRVGLEDVIFVRQGDGLAVLTPGEADSIVIAGMGGRTMIQILAAGADVAKSARRLVLQPQKDADLLRQYLAENGWCIIREELVQEGEHWYQLMAAEKGEMSLSVEEAVFGPEILSRPHPLLGDYLRFRLQSIAAIQESLEQQSGAGAAGRREALQAEAAELNRLLARLDA